MLLLLQRLLLIVCCLCLLRFGHSAGNSVW
jgi:hypothetical protein